MDEVLRQDELRKPHNTWSENKKQTDPSKRQSSIAPEACAPNLANQVEESLGLPPTHEL